MLVAACGGDSSSDPDASVVVFPDAASSVDAAIPDAFIPDASPDANLTNAPPAFRVTRLWLRDPHVFTPVLPSPLESFSCQDVTDMPVFGFSANGQIQTNITTDGDDPDSNLDLSLIAVFNPLDTTGAATGELTFATGDCDKDSPRDCSQSATATPQVSMYTNTAVGACMPIDPTTLSPVTYTPDIDEPLDNCFASGEVTMGFDLAGAQVTLHNVSVAAIYNGDPNVQSLVTGVMRGFLSQVDAETTMINVGGMSIALDELLPGTSTCPGLHDDRDNLIPDDVKSTLGWWFYFNFEATRLLGWSAAQ